MSVSSRLETCLNSRLHGLSFEFLVLNQARSLLLKTLLLSMHAVLRQLHVRGSLNRAYATK